MITYQNIFSTVDKQKEQSFFGTSKDLQDHYDNLCDECTRLSIREQELLKDGDIKGATIVQEYLAVEQAKLDQFIKKYDIKF